MSSYTDYNYISNYYDNIRRPCNADVWLGNLMVHTSKALADLHVLDAGCGTGNYARVLLENCLGKVSLVDGSDGMLTKAKAKLEPFKDRLNIIEKTLLPKLPLEDGSVDAVMLNQVVHHLADPDCEKDPFKKIRECYIETRRVLNDGGLLLISVTFKEQLRSNWYVNLMPDPIIERFQKKLLSNEEHTFMLKEAGFEVIERYIPMVGVRSEHSEFFNSNGPLSVDFRNSDSIWSTLSEAELAGIVEYWSKVTEAGEAKQEMYKLDEFRRKNGMDSYVIAKAI